MTEGGFLYAALPLFFVRLTPTPLHEFSWRKICGEGHFRSSVKIGLRSFSIVEMLDVCGIGVPRISYSGADCGEAWHWLSWAFVEWDYETRPSCGGHSESRLYGLQFWGLGNFIGFWDRIVWWIIFVLLGCLKVLRCDRDDRLWFHLWRPRRFFVRLTPTSV